MRKKLIASRLKRKLKADADAAVEKAEDHADPEAVVDNAVAHQVLAEVEEDPVDRDSEM